ncbi:hypothetical protein ACOYR1_04200 [Thalassotalea piscium]
MLTSIILALSVSTTPVSAVETQDLLSQNNVATPEVVARKSVRIARKSVRIARKSVRIARKSVRIEDTSSRISTSL